MLPRIKRPQVQRFFFALPEGYIELETVGERKKNGVVWVGCVIGRRRIQAGQLDRQHREE